MRTMGTRTGHPVSCPSTTRTARMIRKEATVTHRVGLVCAAGVSSTFLAHGLRVAIADAGLDAVKLEPLSADRAVTAEVDLLLLAHHLRGAADELRTAAAAPIVLLTTDDRAAVIDEAIGEIARRVADTASMEGH